MTSLTTFTRPCLELSPIVPITSRNETTFRRIKFLIYVYIYRGAISNLTIWVPGPASDFIENDQIKPQNYSCLISNI